MNAGERGRKPILFSAAVLCCVEINNIFCGEQGPTSYIIISAPTAAERGRERERERERERVRVRGRERERGDCVKVNDRCVLPNM